MWAPAQFGQSTLSSGRTVAPGFLNNVILQQFNVLADSRDFTVANSEDLVVYRGWEKFNSSISTGEIAPDGTATAQKMVEDSSTGWHRMYGPSDIGWALASVPTNLVWRLAVVAKADERTRLVIALKFTGGSIVWVGFDLAGGNVGYDNVATADWTIDATSISAAIDGWRQCTIDAKYTSATPQAGLAVGFWLDNGSGTAARSISYAGDGTSGVLLHQVSLLPKVMWDITGQAFRDDFYSLDTIDLEDTREPGFNWYIHNAWPNFALDMATHNFRGTYPPTNPASLTVSDSILTIANDGSSLGTVGPSISLASACADPLDPGQYIGNVYGGGTLALYEVRGAWDPSIPLNNINALPDIYVGSGIAFWTVGIDGFTGQGVGASRGTENDVCEAGFVALTGNVAFLANFHDMVWEPFVSTHVAPLAGEQPASDTDHHRFASVVCPANAASNNIGFRMEFYDGVAVKASLHTWTTTGDYSLWNTQAQMLFLGGGTGTIGTPVAVPTEWAFKVDYVRVFQ